MTPDEKLKLKRVVARFRAMNKSEASCYCGRYYRLNFDTALTEELDVAETIIDRIPVSWLEV